MNSPAYYIKSNAVAALAMVLLYSGVMSLSAQGLDKIAPFSLQRGMPPDSISFILTANDFTFFKGKPDKYENSIQILDANMPWPPRWFMAMPLDTARGLPYSALIPVNASFQHHKMSFFTICALRIQGKIVNKRCFIFCNEKMEPVDTLFFEDYELDHHEMCEAVNGDKLYFAKKDTFVHTNARNGKDTLLHCLNEVIQIADSTGRCVFSWDPLVHLGLESEYDGYKKLSAQWYKGSAYDWSHANSLAWDIDGNILYSFRFIGIGKISRKDGHIIWRIDRKQQRPNVLSDSIPIFLQHDLKSYRDESGRLIYTVWSSGDDTHQLCEGYQFAVENVNGNMPVFRLLRKFKSEQSPANSDGGGNYDMEANSNFLVNYGKYKEYIPDPDAMFEYRDKKGRIVMMRGLSQKLDSSAERMFFEYRDKNNKIIGQYNAPNIVLSYRVHRLEGWRPVRPLISNHDGSLTTDTKEECTWYKIADGKKVEVIEVGHGNTFKPSESAVYCVVVKYGIGYSVSLPFNFAK